MFLLYMISLREEIVMVMNKIDYFQTVEKTNQFRIIILFFLLMSFFILSGCKDGTQTVKSPAAASTMKPFGSKDAFAAFQKKAAEKSAENLSATEGEAANATADAAATPSEAPPPGAAAPAIEAKTDAANPEITNNQNIGVDEGGIVKQVGNFLLTLQEGRIFVVNTKAEGSNPLKLTDRFNVYRSKDTGAWYDEMLVSGNRVLITAYSYEDQATEISVFTLSDQGKLSRNGRFMLSSYDYFSSENYATRLVGDNLVIYTPHSVLDLNPTERQSWPSLTVMADANAKQGKATPLFNESDIYAPGYDYPFMMVHAVSVCSLKNVTSADQVGCKTTSFIGAQSLEFYVSGQDAFIWSAGMEPYSSDDEPKLQYDDRGTKCIPARNPPQPTKAAIYRVPLSGEAPSMLGVRGTPIDQFSMESRDGRFMMLVDQSTVDCKRSEKLTFLNIGLDAFAGQYEERKSEDYVILPKIDDQAPVNRFVGDWLLIGSNQSFGSNYDDFATPQLRNPETKKWNERLIAVPINDPKSAQTLPLPFYTQRIERAGGNAVLTGHDQEQASLHFVMINLNARNASLGASLKIDGMQESESRSHGYGASIDNTGNGLIGIPTEKASPSGLTWSSNESDTSDISFIKVSPTALTEAGRFTVNGREPSNGYRCEVSCIDWYGNARPIFTGGRIFGMMGTELVEGRMERGEMQTIHRLDLTGVVG
jgi:hypothetical protein